MIRAHHTFAGKLLSELYSGPKLNESFRDVCFIGDAEENRLPALMIANHFSWWDGFIQYRLNKTYFHRKMYVM
ncbi:MAG: hypothetical protein LIO93_07110, partial [Bacteroidales bacterium]|nr:hypothetical protein [Bacteroidales bacterium]